MMELNKTMGLVCCTIAIAIGGLSLRAAEQPRFSSRVVSDLSEFLDGAEPVLRNPDSVAISVVMPKRDRKALFDYNTVATRVLSSGELSALQSMLFSENTYHWPFRKLENGIVRWNKVSGYSLWNIKLRATRGSDFVVMYFGFPGTISLQVNDGPFTIVYMGPGRRELLKFFQDLFPKAAALRSEGVQQ